MPRPSYDSEIAPVLAAMNFTPTLTLDRIDFVREKSAPTSHQALAGRAVLHEQRTIVGPGSDIILSIIRSSVVIEPSSEKIHPGILYTHGGGMIAGNWFMGIGTILDWVEEHNAVCVSVEYRLPPQHPDPAPIEDCYAALLWVHENLDNLRIDPDKLMIAGSSAGGGIAAGTALLSRDRGGPRLCGHVLICPMLDDRNDTISSYQYVEAAISLVIVVVEIRSASMLLQLVPLTSRDYPLRSLMRDLLKFFEMKLSIMRVFYGNLEYKQNCMCGLGDFMDSIF
jgi:acetyl esterase/lipase